MDGIRRNKKEGNEKRHGQHTNLGDTLVKGKIAEGVDGLLETGLGLLGLEELGKLTLGSLIEIWVGHVEVYRVGGVEGKEGSEERKGKRNAME